MAEGIARIEVSRIALSATAAPVFLFPLDSSAVRLGISDSEIGVMSDGIKEKTGTARVVYAPYISFAVK